ncbi:MAG: hypothetical protein JWO85_328 [Candidatus Eremiobacteraeota bacterium]|nr:hypothetical protein [Candidatus Eremiobacteraeota bacterium]
MRPLTLAFLLMPSVVLGGPASSASAAGQFSDTLCPNATAAVVGLSALKTADPPERVYAAAHAASAAYETCAKEFLANGNAEPGMHYAYTRQAAFGVLAARALVRQDRLADAKREFEADRRLAAEVVDWRLGGSRVTSSANVSGTNDVTRTGDTRGSRYAASAKEIVDAIDAELRNIAAPVPGPSPRPGG